MSDETPDNVRTIMYVLTGLGALKCSACGVLVDAGQAATHAHTTVHALIGDALDGLGVRVAALEEAGSPAPAERPMWGAATDRLVKGFLTQTTAPADTVRITITGSRDQVGAAAAALAELVPLEAVGPIFRDATPPIEEARIYAAEVDAIRARAAQVTAALAGRGRIVPARIPGPDVVEAERAATIGHHVRAMAMHLEAAAEAAAEAGLHGQEPESELGLFLTETAMWVMGLYAWAERSADKSGVPREAAGAGPLCAPADEHPVDEPPGVGEESGM